MASLRIKPLRTIFAAALTLGMAACSSAQSYDGYGRPGAFEGAPILPSSPSIPANDHVGNVMPYTIRTFDPVTGQYQDEIGGSIRIMGRQPRIVGRCQTIVPIMDRNITFGPDGRALPPRQIGATVRPMRCPGARSPNLVVW